MEFSSKDSATKVNPPAPGDSFPGSFVTGSTPSSLCISPGQSSNLVTNESHKEAGCVDDGTSLPSLSSSAEEPNALAAATSKPYSGSKLSKGGSHPISAITSQEMYHVMYHIGAEEVAALSDEEEGSGVVRGNTLKGPLEASFPCLPKTSCCARLEETYQAVYHDKAQQRRLPLPSQNSGRQSGTLCHGHFVTEVSCWDFPVDDQGHETMKKLDYVTSQVLNGMDVGYSGLKTPSSTHRKKRGRIQRWSSRKGVHVGSSATDPFRQRHSSPLVRDVSYDTRYLQYDESPYGYLDQLVPLPGNNPPNCIPRMDSTFLRSIPEPVANLRGSRVGPGYQARVPRRKDNYHDKRNAAYLPK